MSKLVKTKTTNIDISQISVVDKSYLSGDKLDVEDVIYEVTFNISDFHFEAKYTISLRVREWLIIQKMLNEKVNGRSAYIGSLSQGQIFLLPTNAIKLYRQHDDLDFIVLKTPMMINSFIQNINELCDLIQSSG